MSFEFENSFERCARLREKLDARYAPAPSPTIESVKAVLEAAQKTLATLEAQAATVPEEAAQAVIAPTTNYAGINADNAAQSSVPIDHTALFNDELRLQGHRARY